MTKTQLRRWAALALVLALSAAGFAAWSYTQERHDLPPFDRAKAAMLSPEKRAEYERMLFNELDNGWNTGTPLFKGDDATARREAAWLAAANDGYELAYLVLQVVQPRGGHLYANEKPLRRLEELIAEGDAGAMCMWLPLSSFVAYRDDQLRKRYRVQGLKYLRMGLEKQHPFCMLRVGYFTLLGWEGFNQDRSRGFELLVESERQGYGGSVALDWYLYRQPVTLKNLERRFCWEGFTARYQTPIPYFMWRAIRRFAERNPGPEAQRLVEKIEHWEPTLSECVDLGIGDEE